MLRRKFRLTSAQDYATTYRHGRRLRTRGFSCVVVAQPAATRFGVVVSKKVSLKATRRNHYRRWLWAALRSLKPNLPPRGYHLIFIVAPGIRDLTYHQVVADLETTIKKQLGRKP